MALSIEYEFNPNLQSEQEKYSRVKQNANIVRLCAFPPFNKHQVPFLIERKILKGYCLFSHELSVPTESFCRIGGSYGFPYSFAVINWSFSCSFIQMVLLFLSLLMPKTRHFTILCSKVPIYKNLVFSPINT